MTLPIMLEEGAFMPEYKTRGSSGFDLAYRGGETLTLEPGKIVPVPTGIPTQGKSGSEQAGQGGLSGPAPASRGT